MSRFNKYIINLLVSIDQFGNALLGGDPDETISSRAAKRRSDSALARGLCNVLDSLDHGHCDRYIETDEGDNASL